jgi:hypothetical protein
MAEIKEKKVQGLDQEISSFFKKYDFQNKYCKLCERLVQLAKNDGCKLYSEEDGVCSHYLHIKTKQLGSELPPGKFLGKPRLKGAHGMLYPVESNVLGLVWEDSFHLKTQRKSKACKAKIFYNASDNSFYLRNLNADPNKVTVDVRKVRKGEVRKLDDFSTIVLSGYLFSFEFGK